MCKLKILWLNKNGKLKKSNAFYFIKKHNSISQMHAKTMNQEIWQWPRWLTSPHWFLNLAWTSWADRTTVPPPSEDHTPLPWFASPSFHGRYGRLSQKKKWSMYFLRLFFRQIRLQKIFLKSKLIIRICCKCIYVCMHVCICMHACKSMYACMCVYVCVHRHIQTLKPVCLYSSWDLT